MPDELTELLDSAIYKEVASQAVYEAAQSKTQDPDARALIKELAKEEHGHAERLKKFKEKGFKKEDWHKKEVTNLKISEYLTAPDSIEGAGLQDLLIFAMKREQQAIEFYSKMTRILRDKDAKDLCESLIHEELKHKLRLELLYDDSFYGED
ncbi:ferritin family protein [Chloroflexota bacterium]